MLFDRPLDEGIFGIVDGDDVFTHVEVVVHDVSAVMPRMDVPGETNVHAGLEGELNEN